MNNNERVRRKLDSGISFLKPISVKQLGGLILLLSGLVFNAAALFAKPGFVKKERHSFVLKFRMDSTLESSRKTEMNYVVLTEKPEKLEVIPVQQPSFVSQFSISSKVNGIITDSEQRYNTFSKSDDVFLSGHRQHYMLFTEKQRAVGKKLQVSYSESIFDLVYFPQIYVSDEDSVAEFQISIDHPTSILAEFTVVLAGDSVAFRVSRQPGKTTLNFSPFAMPEKGREHYPFNGIRAIVYTKLTQNGRVLNGTGAREFTEWYFRKMLAKPQLDSASVVFADHLLKEISTPEAKIDTVFRWVQRNIRYIADASGGHSFFPHSPGSVIKNKFGDCKDRAFLIYAITKHIGHPVYPALVSTTPDLAIPHVHLNNYNHVINVWNRNGETIFLDPTDPFSSGNRLASWAAGKKVLVLNPDASAELKIPGEAAKRALEISISAHPDSLKNARTAITFKGAYLNQLRKVKTGNPAELENFAIHFVSSNLQKTSVTNLINTTESDSSITLFMQSDLTGFLIRSNETWYVPKIPFLHFNNALSKRLDDQLPLFLDNPDALKLSIALALNKPVQPDRWTSDGVHFQYNMAVSPKNGGISIDYDFQSKEKMLSNLQKTENKGFFSSWGNNKNKLVKLK